MSPVIGNPRFAVLGPKGSFSHIAAMRYAATAGHKNPKFVFYEEFGNLHEAMDKGDADYCVHPVFNMLGGPVGINQNIFQQLIEDSISAAEDGQKQHKDYSIYGTVNLEINLALMVKPGTKFEQLTSTLCYPHGNLQFEKFAKENKLAQGKSKSTAAAAKTLSESDDFTIGAVASKEAAEIYGLEILHENIADVVEGQPDNHTIFVVTGAKRKHRKNARQGIIFEVNDVENDLENALKPFEEENVNIPYIESFYNPTLKKTYMYCEVDADTTQDQLDKTCYKLIGQGRSTQLVEKMQENKHLMTAMDADDGRYKYDMHVKMKNVSGYLRKVLAAFKFNIPHIQSVPDSKNVVTSMHFKFGDGTLPEDLYETCAALEADECEVSLWENKTRSQPKHQ